MAKDFTWHEVSEEERLEIKKESKKLLNEFASKLSSIKSSDGHFENETGMRDEGEGWTTDLEFQNTTLSNAPLSEDGTIVAETGDWKK